MILTDREILNLNILKEYDVRHLTPNGYDLRIREILFDDTRITEGTVKIKAGQPFFIATREIINLVDQPICASLFIRSSFARRSCFISDGKVDAGFCGTLTISCIAFQDLELQINQTFVQIVFEQLSQKSEKQYSDYSGNYQNQTNVQLSK